jgi:hypothetical protein
MRTILETFRCKVPFEKDKPAIEFLWRLKMTSFEKYMKAVSMMVFRGLSDDEIRDVTVSIIGSFKQGTGLGGSDIEKITHLVRTSGIYKVKCVEVVKQKNFPSGTHAPKYVIVSSDFGGDVAKMFYSEGGENFVTVLNPTPTDKVRVVFSHGDTPQSAWERFME